jgi:hypothetical protein
MAHFLAEGAEPSASKAWPAQSLCCELSCVRANKTDFFALHQEVGFLPVRFWKACGHANLPQRLGGSGENFFGKCLE